ncbi:aminopeptidase N [Amylibacter sp.]|nr:aminopeptidase N [Amylibacter sp.]
MRQDEAPQILLSDYQEPAFWVETVDLFFKLDPTKTRVKSNIKFIANPNRIDGPHSLELDGRMLKLISAEIDNSEIDLNQININTEGLSISSEFIPQSGFTWTSEVEINPQSNTALEGLYISKGMYCTQCEAQGFRKITYYPDRPDVMALFNVTIESTLPTLLSNGNKMGHGKWQDPWVKPAYLFALVAGDLVFYEDTFITKSGRNVDLQIYVREGDQSKCEYAMDALKRSMKWDEEIYKREYDLDLFMIVAVDDFNMGAMENKGLNIFNSKYVLASQETATDRDFELIEGIIAHEYFHNWTGNRITCKNWFQLCLKEGLTVFRDQQFSADQRSLAVKRIEDVIQLRSRQFREDAGPLAHPCRPEKYVEINNFYTSTVYEKGSEIIGMLKLLVGDASYYKALELYFDRHDGQACTIEDWIKVFEDSCEIDLTQFKLWYSQSGTPKVTVKECYKDGVLELTLDQDQNPSLNRRNKLPQVIPIRTGFIGKSGLEILPEVILNLYKKSQTFYFKVNEKPIISLLRGFSAPIILEQKVNIENQTFLFKNDTDTFNKWEAGRNISIELLISEVNETTIDLLPYIEALSKIISDENLDLAYRSLLLTLPSQETIAQSMFERGIVPDPDKIFTAVTKLELCIAKNLNKQFINTYKNLTFQNSYTPDPRDAGQRSLRNASLKYITKLDSGKAALEQFKSADNMTEQLSALGLIIAADIKSDCIGDFYNQWRSDSLVIDKWFAIQITSAPPKKALEIAKKLSSHVDFNWKNPNRFRSLIGSFAMMPCSFHMADGSGYEFVANWLIKLDKVNPQTAARMCGVFETWKRYDKKRQILMTTQLRKIQTSNGLSKDAAEIVNKILK